jgi:hypothetical protein
LKKNKRRRCLCCRQLFHCHPRTRAQQKYCAEPACRAASKKASQRRWLQKPENQDYFCGPQHVSRVQAWREAHRENGRKAALPRRPLQETITRQPIDRLNKSSGLALQESIRPQGADTAEQISTWGASTLQDAM